jgi:hypothetical protein
MNNTLCAVTGAALLLSAGCTTRNPMNLDSQLDDAGTADRSRNDAGAEDAWGPEGPLHDGPVRDIWIPDAPRPDLPTPPDAKPPQLDGSGPIVKDYWFPASLKKAVDILFVVDNSNSMAQEQSALAQAFPQFIDMLATMSAGMPDTHIGVISTDLGAGNYQIPSCEVAGGDGGKLENNPRKAGCTPPKDPYVSYLGGVTNVPGSGSALDRVKSGFSCIAEIGTGGCGFENTIEASRRAVDPKLNVNPGFVRQDAMLVVIYLTDEDDCSAQKPQLYDPNQYSITDPLGPLTSFRCFEFGIQCTCAGGAACTRTTVGPRTNCKPAFNWLYQIQDYITFFKGLKPPGQILMAALTGPETPVSTAISYQNPELQPSCQSSNGSAVPAIRIKALLDGFGTASFFSSICDTSFGPPLKKLGTQIASQLGEACLQALTDVSPAPGMQADCKVSEQIGGLTKAVPACASQSGPCNPCPCWRVNPDTSCSALSGYSLQIARSAPAAAGTLIHAQCLGPK